ncbi:MAG: AAA family ATPase, partial [bacterium]
MDDQKIVKVAEICEMFKGEVLGNANTAQKADVDKRSSSHDLQTSRTPTPKDIYRQLESTVFGQEKAKKSLAVVIYQQLIRYMLRNGKNDMPKTNALLIGPSGCGKTMMAKSMADIIGLPFLKLDATSMVQRGYRGGAHMDHIVPLLLSEADNVASMA